MTLSVNPVAQSTQTASTSLASGSGGTASQIANISSSEFLNLLVTELTNQNPLSPMNPSQMVSQTSQLSTVQILNNLSTEIQGLQSQDAVLQGAGMIGQTVTYSPSQGTYLSGTVSGVAIQNGVLNLNIGGSLVPASQVVAVGMAPATA